MQMSLRLFAPTEFITVAKPPALEELVASAKGYAAEVRASSTRRAYLTDFRSFESWCRGRGLSPLPATSATVAIYVAALADAGRRPSTIQRALAGIAFVHRARGHLWPGGGGAVGQVMTGIRRRHGTAPEQKAPIEDGELALMVGTLGEGLVGLRDRALLTLGWAGAFRRSELVALRVQDVTRTREGLVVRLERSKNDQKGRGEVTGISPAADPSLCPVGALSAWLDAAEIASGPLFRGSTGSVGCARRR